MFRATVRMTVTFDSETVFTEEDIRGLGIELGEHIIDTYNDNDSIAVVVVGTDRPGSAELIYERGV